MLPPLGKGMRAVKAYDAVTRNNVQISRNGKSLTLENLRLNPDDLTVVAVVLNKNVR